jgi:hypothetical protein
MYLQITQEDFCETAYFTLGYFLMTCTKKMVEKATIEEVQMIDSQPNMIGLVKGKCLVCNQGYLVHSYSFQNEYNNPGAMLNSTLSILMEMINIKSKSHSAKFLLRCIKEVFIKLKQSVQAKDFFECELVSQTVKKLMESCEKLFSRADDSAKRTRVYDIVGVCFCEDETDNYLSNLQSIINMILTKQNPTSTSNSKSAEVVD